MVEISLRQLRRFVVQRDVIRLHEKAPRRESDHTVATAGNAGAADCPLNQTPERLCERVTRRVTLAQGIRRGYRSAASAVRNPTNAANAVTDPSAQRCYVKKPLGRVK
jgi:hypothetical protein